MKKITLIAIIALALASCVHRPKPTPHDVPSPLGTTVSVQNKTIYTNEINYVSFTGASGSKYDWLGIYVTGSSNTNYVDWLYTDGTRNGLPGGTAGTVVFTNYLYPGNYDVRLFFNNSFALQAADQFRVVPRTPALSVSKQAYAPQERIQVSFTGAPGYWNDWIGLYATGAANDRFIDWLYTSGTQNKGASNISRGDIVFTNGLPVGSYEARMFSAGSYTNLAAASFAVPQYALTLTWNYDLNYQSTNNTFRVYHSTTGAQPWDVMAVVPVTDVRQALFTTTVRVGSGRHFFSLTTSNLWGESAYSPVLEAPPLAQTTTLKLQ